MRLIILSLLSTILLSSCTLDSVHISTVPTPRYYRVLPTNHLYQTRYYYDLRPDYVRYRYGRSRRIYCPPALR
jgi:hypothetical protein